mmetsp:Transcript_37414/g.57314  ORF Transcript_37414/g.57314 Transcript_37414/m.57314 type:complete len:169 (+) Transcript_37414:1915-2421(+)
MALYFLTLVIGLPTIKNYILHFRLEGQRICNTPSHFALATKYYKPDDSGPAGITKRIKEYLQQEHQVSDIAYVVPLYDLSEYWAVFQQVENCRASLLEIGDKLDKGEVQKDKPTEDKIQDLNRSLSEHEEMLGRMSSIYESHFSVIKSQVSMEFPLLATSKKQDNIFD